jgi:hypothetical protein
VSPVRSSLTFSTFLTFVALATLAACVRPKAVACGDGWCPAGAVCTNGQCRDLSNCGDGVTSTDEECDDGPNNSGASNAHCREDCTLARCGDGVVDKTPIDRAAEACDEGLGNSDVDPDHCRESCVLARCGDGIVDSGEERGCFETAVELSTGAAFARPTLRVADLDRDGLGDLVVGEPKQGKLRVFFGLPAGTWQEVAVPVDGAWKQVAIGQFDDDPALDLAVMLEMPRQIEPFLLAGRTFVATAVVGEGSFADPNLVGAGDLSGDGLDDLVVMGRRGITAEGGVVQALQATGAGTFVEADTLDYIGLPAAAAVTRLFGDARDDLVFLDQHDHDVERVIPDGRQDGIVLTLADTPPPFDFEDLSTAGNITLGHFDPDEFVDFAIPQATHAVVLRGGLEGFNRRLEIDIGEPVSSVANGDLDDDGQADLVVAGLEGHVRPVYFNTVGTPRLGKSASFAGAAGPSTELVDLQVADLDGDSFLETVGVADNRLLALRGGEGLYTRAPASIDRVCDAVALGDFDGDGVTDVALDGDDVAWFRHVGREYIRGPVAPVTVSRLFAGDLNGDHGPESDLIGYDGMSGQVFVWHKGPGTEMLEVQHLNGPMDGESTLADVNQDGRPDLVVVDSANLATVLPGRADGTFGAAVTSQLVSSANVNYYELGDVDGDHLLDLISETTSLLVFRGRGDGTFVATPVEVVTGSFSVFTTGHFDGDDLLDFAYVDRDKRTLEVLRGRGLAPAKGIQSLPVGEVPTLMFGGDVDGNGRTDLVLVSTQSTGQLLLARRDGKMASPLTVPVQGKGTGLLEDLNGDGRADLVFKAGLGDVVQIFTSRRPTPTR